MALSLRSACATPSGLRARPASRGVVSVRAFFGNKADQDRKKEEAWEAQQALLEERRAKRDRIMRDFGRKGAQPESPKEARPAPAPKRAAKQEVVEVYEEEEVEEAPKSSNPLAGLLGGFFKK
ncbi:hypothetical protein HYH03_008590 [Edaphochlamys debaryana]|uniref:Uncharacterized protein n=1 Tax=Edaphochlamys debaryana TaxID=47281 RepID=A0A836BZ94_9CHLO|nr:hypothetical protein HYH03_008590 [Edaphochlamys debaryana]|eukprot:KAG2493168.1 hypothetical protein HYH03_008590 [Edaphochlamys debaryana]